MSRNVEHVVIPDSIINRIQNAPDKVRECIQVAAETIATLRSQGFSGVLVATIGWEDKLPDILERI